MDAAALLAMKEFAGDDGDINLDSLIFEDGADEALASMLASSRVLHGRHRRVARQASRAN